MPNLILQHWNSKERKLPEINCIAYPNGIVTILNCYSLYNPNTMENKMFCAPLCDTSIESIEKYGSAYWTVVDPWISVGYRGGKIYGGDGSMGNQGYIACANAGDMLLWGMFFENTNPIKKLEIDGNQLIATNEHEELQVKIDLSNLTNIKMVLIQK